MSLFNKKRVFHTIEFANVPGVFDYPKHLPIPREGEIVVFDGKSGMVDEVRYITESNVTDIRIVCARYKI